MCSPKETIDTSAGGGIFYEIPFCGQRYQASVGAVIHEGGAAMFKSAFIVMAPDGDPKKHRAVIKTSKAELTSVIIGLGNFDQAVEVCTDLVRNEGVQAFIL